MTVKTPILHTDLQIICCFNQNLTRLFGGNGKTELKFMKRKGPRTAGRTLPSCHAHSQTRPLPRHQRQLGQGSSPRGCPQEQPPAGHATLGPGLALHTRPTQQTVSPNLSPNWSVCTRTSCGLRPGQRILRAKSPSRHDFKLDNHCSSGDMLRDRGQATG